MYNIKTFIKQAIYNLLLYIFIQHIIHIYICASCKFQMHVMIHYFVNCLYELLLYKKTAHYTDMKYII